MDLLICIVEIINVYCNKTTDISEFFFICMYELKFSMYIYIKKLNKNGVSYKNTFSFLMVAGGAVMMEMSLRKAFLLVNQHSDQMSPSIKLQNIPTSIKRFCQNLLTSDACIKSICPMSHLIVYFYDVHKKIYRYFIMMFL